MDKVSLVHEVISRLQDPNGARPFRRRLERFLQDPSVADARTARRRRSAPTVHRIDCSVQPSIPDGWRIDPADQIASRFQGELIWTPGKVRLHLDDAQKTGVIVGNDLKVKLEGQPVLPANVFDYLRAHPTLIPEEWKEKAVFFWGTIYRHSDGVAFVRYLCWDEQGWRWGDGWLDDDWHSDYPSAVLAG